MLFVRSIVVRLIYKRKTGGKTTESEGHEKGFHLMRLLRRSSAHTHIHLFIYGFLYSYFIYLYVASLKERI